MQSSPVICVIELLIKAYLLRLCEALMADALPS